MRSCEHVACCNRTRHIRGQNTHHLSLDFSVKGSLSRAIQTCTYVHVLQAHSLQVVYMYHGQQRQIFQGYCTAHHVDGSRGVSRVGALCRGSARRSSANVNKDGAVSARSTQSQGIAALSDTMAHVSEIYFLIWSFHDKTVYLMTHLWSLFQA